MHKPTIRSAQTFVECCAMPSPGTATVTAASLFMLGPAEKPHGGSDSDCLEQAAGDPWHGQEIYTHKAGASTGPQRPGPRASKKLARRGHEEGRMETLPCGLKRRTAAISNDCEVPGFPPAHRASVTTATASNESMIVCASRRLVTWSSWRSRTSLSDRESAGSDASRHCETATALENARRETSGQGRRR